jgi:hypothetical protein
LLVRCKTTQEKGEAKIILEAISKKMGTFVSRSTFVNIRHSSRLVEATPNNATEGEQKLKNANASDAESRKTPYHEKAHESRAGRATMQGHTHGSTSTWHSSFSPFLFCDP